MTSKHVQYADWIARTLKNSDGAIYVTSEAWARALDAVLKEREVLVKQVQELQKDVAFLEKLMLEQSQRIVDLGKMFSKSDGTSITLDDVQSYFTAYEVEAAREEAT